MRWDLDFMHCYAGGIGTLFAYTFSLEVFPCVAELGGWVLWRREAVDPDQGFVRCQTWREGILVLVFRINKDVMSFFFPNHCSMYYLIFAYEHMMMLFRSLFHVYFIIISLYVVILVLGRYFCRSLGERGARRELKVAWINLRLDKVWTIPINDIVYIFLQNYMHLSFNPSTLMAS